MVTQQDIKDALEVRGVRAEELEKVPTEDFEAFAKAVNAAVPEGADESVWGDALMDESVYSALPQGVEAITKSIEALVKAAKPTDDDDEDEDEKKAAKLAAAKFGKDQKKGKCPDCGEDLDEDGKCPECDEDDLDDDDENMGKSLSDLLAGEMAQYMQHNDDGEVFVDVEDMLKSVVTSIETFMAQRDGEIMGALAELKRGQDNLNAGLGPITESVQAQEELRKSVEARGVPTRPAGRPVRDGDIAHRGSEFGAGPQDASELLTKALAAGQITVVQKGTIERDIANGMGSMHEETLAVLRKSLTE
jgi:hypothetical protein